MNVTFLKRVGKKEVINRVDLELLAANIQSGSFERSVTHLRELYHLMNPHRQADGQISTQWEEIGRAHV